MRERDPRLAALPLRPPSAVVEGASRRGDAVVTSDITHIRKVAEAARAVLRIESI
jgi:hypothetical protein